MKRRQFAACLLATVFAAAAPAFAAEEKKTEPKAAPQDDTFDQDSVLRDAEQFFGRSTEGLARVIEKAFKDHGRPNAYVKGEEIAGAIAVGLRYGNGTMVLKNGKMRPVWWTGPSIGFDAGANASKVFVLVYHLPRPSAIFQRFPGVDGSFYFIGGAGINYQQRDAIILAPIRLGVGLRAGASVGYMRYTSKKTYNPF